MGDEIINVAVGDGFRIPLKTIATAGYVWKIDSFPDSIQAVKTENEKQRDDAKPGDLNIQIFYFRALKRGQDTITFALARPWENKAIKSRTVIVLTT